MIISINYDLKLPGRNYNELYSAIKRLGPWWHYLGSTWLVETQLDAQATWNALSTHIDKNDRMLIVRITADTAGWLTKEAWDWIKNRDRKTA